MDLGVSEAARKTGNFLGNSALGSLAKKFANTIEKKSGGMAFPVKLSDTVDANGVRKMLGINTALADNRTSSLAPTKENAASKGMSVSGPSLGSVAETIKGEESGRGASNRNAEVAKMIGSGWDDSNDLLKDTSNALGKTKNVVSNLGKVKKQFLSANDEYKRKTDEAIAGNKLVVEKNQKDELDDLAEDTRNSADNAAIMLGVKGASGGSASKAASRAISKSAGKARATVLKSRGDEFSGLTQEEEKARLLHEQRIKDADEWEQNAKSQALAELESDLKALDRLKKNKSKWREEDIKAESDARLGSFMQNLANISARAKTIREGISNTMSNFGGAVSELESAAIDVTPPAELMTPDFSENIDLQTENNAEDFFDPANAGKQRVIIGRDALGNPIYADDPALAPATV